MCFASFFPGVVCVLLSRVSAELSVVSDQSERVH